MERQARSLARGGFLRLRGVEVHDVVKELHCVGFGSPRGAKIPINAGDGLGESFLRDVDGAEVVDLSGADASLPNEMVAFLAAGESALQAARAAVGTGPRIPMDEIRAIDPTADRIELLLLNDEVNDYAPDAAALTYELVPGDSYLTFTIDASQPSNNNTELELEDDAADGTSEGVTHPYNLYVVKDGTTYTLDPNFVNRN